MEALRIWVRENHIATTLLSWCGILLAWKLNAIHRDILDLKDRLVELRPLTFGEHESRRRTAELKAKLEETLRQREAAKQIHG